jgi:DNA-binding NarL/FixJ family response regulator/HD-like signal output (HDOD) protein
MDKRINSLGINPSTYKPYSVMIIDDSKMDRLLLQKYLQSELFKVDYLMENGKSALSFLQTHPHEIDIICLDYEMPEMNGLELLKEITTTYPKIKTIMVTKSNDKETILEITKYKISAMIVKPISRDQVVEKFIRALGRNDLIIKDEIVKGKVIRHEDRKSDDSNKKTENTEKKIIPLGIHPKTQKPYTVMIVDDSKIDQMLLKKFLQTEMFEVKSIFASPKLAVEELEKNSISYDIICIDYDMPEINGLVLLEDVKNRFPHLITVMATGNSEKEFVQKIFKLKVNGMILKPMNRDKIVEKFSKVLNRKDIMDKNVVGYQMSGEIDVNNLKIPPAPTILLKILETEFSTTDGSSELEKIISSDKAISIDILRVSNSSFYGRSGSVKNLKDAITLLGIKTIKNLILVLSNRQYTNLLEGKTFRKYITDIPLIASLISLDLLSPLNQKKLINEIFTFSLFRKIGATILALNFPKRYLDVLRLFEFGTKDIITLEKEEFLTTSIEIGIRVFKLWNFPDDFIELIQKQNFNLDQLEGVNDIDRITRLAELLAKKLITIPIIKEEEELITAIFKYYNTPEELQVAFNQEYFENLKDHPYLIV